MILELLNLHFSNSRSQDAHHKPGGGDMYDYHHLIINSASMQKKKKSDSIYRVIILKCVQNSLSPKAEIFIIITFKPTDLLESIGSINILTRDHYWLILSIQLS